MVAGHGNGGDGKSLLARLHGQREAIEADMGIALRRGLFLASPTTQGLRAGGGGLFFLEAAQRSCGIIEDLGQDRLRRAVCFDERGVLWAPDGLEQDCSTEGTVGRDRRYQPPGQGAQPGESLFRERGEDSLPMQEQQGEEAVAIPRGFAFLTHSGLDQGEGRGGERGESRNQRFGQVLFEHGEDASLVLHGY